MKNLTAKYLSLMMLASLLSGNAAQAGDGYMNNGGDCCPRQYECGCNPLYCGAWDLQVQAGVAPVTWRNRGPLTAINCTVTPPAGPVISLLTATPRFSRFFKTPWIVGAQVGYAMSDNSRVFVEFDYTQASRKDAVVVTNDFVTPTGTTTFTFGKFKLFEAYVGARYYWDRWCDHLSFFLGGKIGLVHHKRQNATIALAFTGITTQTLTDVPFNRNSSVVAGGGHIGLDYCICGNWSLVLTGEVVASCGPRGVGAIHLTTPTSNGVTDIFTPSIGTALRFPVTLAVRYSF